MSRSPRERRAPYRAAPIPDARYIDNDAAFSSVLRDLVSCDRYGIDTEFVRERTYFARLALVQIAWAGGIVLIDPLRVDIAALSELFDSDVLAIFHAADQDLEALERACAAVPRRIVDVQVASGFLGMSTPSLQSLVERYLGYALEKGSRLTDWTRRPLGAADLAYAAGDVAFLLELDDLLRAELSARGRLAWAELEYEELKRKARAPVVPEQAWWRIKNARQLRGQERQVAQSVAAWRERRAQRLDVPARTVLPDLSMLAIIQRPPGSKEELNATRGIDGRHVSGESGAELLAAIAAGRALSPAELVTPPAPPTERGARPAVALASAWVAERAKALSIDPAILATRADLEAYLRMPPEGRLQTSWRAELIGGPIRRLVAGDAALALDKNGSVVLEERSRQPIISEP